MMSRFYRQAWLSLATLTLLACARSAPPPAARAEDAVAPREQLSRLVEAYWNQTATSSPWYSWGGAESRYGEAPADRLSAQELADALATERRYLAQVLLVPRAPLDPDSRMSYDIFWRERALAIESFTYPAELMPVNAYEGVPQRFALMASAAERYALASERDLENWRLRAANYERWTNQAIANLREGMRRGYTLPRVVVERALPVLAALGEDSPTNVFFQPAYPRVAPAAAALSTGAETPDAASAGALRSAEASSAAEATSGAEAAGAAPPMSRLTDEERARLAAALNGVVRDKILPAYRTLHDFLQREYLPRSRGSVALSALPLGETWYAYLAKRATGGTSTVAELHIVGLTEVERSRARLQALLAETAFAGNAVGFAEYLRHDPRYSYRSVDELMSAYADLKTRVGAAAPSLFAPMPHADVEIHGVEVFRQATAPPLSYQRAMAYGKIPAILYVNTAGLDTSPAIGLTSQYLREAVPGHHYQLALQQARADLPTFRRFGGAPAFVAGWGLYAAALGEELGMYHDPEAKFGSLLAQLQCAVGLVIDTGIHGQHWTRPQAIDYVHTHLPLDDAAVANVVDRVIAIPGEALSCTVGFVKFQALRARAQQALGPRVDLQAFHEEVLKNGAVPLDLLDANVKQWTETAMAAAPKVD